MLAQSVWLLKCKWKRFTEWKRKRELIVPNKFFFAVLMFWCLYLHVYESSGYSCMCWMLSVLAVCFVTVVDSRRSIYVFSSIHNADSGFFFVLRVALRITTFTRLNHTFLCIEIWNLHEPMHFTKFRSFSL